MTDRELWQAAWKELTLTTDSYPTWKKKGFPATSHWAKAKTLGDQIGQVVTPPPTPSGLRAGVHWHGQWEGTDVTDTRRTKCLDLIAAAGLDLRMDIEWAYLEPAKGVYSAHELAKYDYVFWGCKERGIEILGVPMLTPQWARSGGTFNSPPTNMVDYGNFCAWAARRWPWITAFELWNETDPAQSFWTGTTAQYVQLLKAGYQALKGVNPAIKVVSAGVSSNDDVYVQSLYANGAKPYFDILALHPYQQPSNRPPSTPDSPPARWNYMHYPAVRTVMLNNNDGDKPVWFTEFGYSTHANTGGEANWNLGVTDQQQTDFLMQAFDIAAGWPNVQRLYIYKLDDDTGRGFSVQLENYGIVRHDLTPKPSYTALKARYG